tara:strand:- start:497 stop:1729 length:1233 start_codon:yes stop_codon:yes gene_type:complete
MANVWDMPGWQSMFNYDINPYEPPKRTVGQLRTFRGRILPTVKSDAAKRVREGTMPPGKSLKKYKKWLSESWVQHQADALLAAEATGIPQDSGHNIAKGRGGQHGPSDVGPQWSSHNRKIGIDSGVPWEIGSEIGATNDSMDSWVTYLSDHNDPQLLPEERSLVYHYGRSPEAVLARKELNARRAAEGLPPLVDQHTDFRWGDAVNESGPVRSYAPTHTTASVETPGSGKKPRKFSTPKNPANTLSILNLKNAVKSAVPGPQDALFSAVLPSLALASKGEMDKIPGVVGRNLTEDAVWATGLNLAARTPLGQTITQAVAPYVAPVAAAVTNPFTVAGGLIAGDIAFPRGVGAGSARWGPSTPYKDQNDYYYRLGGGNAYMTKTGASIEETIKNGMKHEVVETYRNIPDKQ